MTDHFYNERHARMEQENRTGKIIHCEVCESWEVMDPGVLPEGWKEDWQAGFFYCPNCPMPPEEV